MATKNTAASGLWSATATWGDSVPVSGDVVNINHDVIFDYNYDIASGVLGAVTISAGTTLSWDTSESVTRIMPVSASMTVNGTLAISGIPSSSIAKIYANYTGSLNLVNVGTSGTVNVICSSNPTNKYVLTNAEWASGSTVNVGTDLTADPLWTSGATICISIPEDRGLEYTTITSVTSSSLEVAAANPARTYPYGSIVVLIDRNVSITAPTGFTGRPINNLKGTVGCLLDFGGNLGGNQAVLGVSQTNEMHTASGGGAVIDGAVISVRTNVAAPAIQDVQNIKNSVIIGGLYGVYPYTKTFPLTLASSTIIGSGPGVYVAAPKHTSIVNCNFYGIGSYVIQGGGATNKIYAKDCFFGGKSAVYNAPGTFINCTFDILTSNQTCYNAAVIDCRAKLYNCLFGLEAGSATSSTTTSLQDTSKSWPVNRWKDYYACFTNGARQGYSQQITGNTSDTLGFAATTDPGACEYSIRKNYNLGTANRPEISAVSTMYCHADVEKYNRHASAYCCVGRTARVDEHLPSGASAYKMTQLLNGVLNTAAWPREAHVPNGATIYAEYQCNIPSALSLPPAVLICPRLGTALPDTSDETSLNYMNKYSLASGVWAGTLGDYYPINVSWTNDTGVDLDVDVILFAGGHATAHSFYWIGGHYVSYPSTGSSGGGESWG